MLAHIGNLICVGDDHLFCLLRTEEFKFCQHLLRSTKIQRCLFVRIGEAFSCHDDPSVDLILRVDKMHITGGNNRLVELFPQSDDLSYIFPKIFL